MKPKLPFMSANIQPPPGWRFLARHEPCQEGDYWFMENRYGNERIEGEDEYGWGPIDSTWYEETDHRGGRKGGDNSPIRLEQTSYQWWIRRIGA